MRRFRTIAQLQVTQQQVKTISRLSPTAWITVQTVSEQTIGVVLFAVQAALLGPHAFGLFSLVMVFIGFCEFVLGLAAAEALISIRTIEALHYQTMTTLNLVISLVLGVAVFGASNQIARLFSEPELGAVLRWMALLPLLSAFCAAPLAASKRELRFRPIALRSIAGLVAGGVVGLALALLGAGVWSLVAQAMVQRSVSAIVLWAAVPLKVRLVVSLRHFQDLQRFAATMMLSRTMNWASAQLPRLALGFFLGAVDLGLFSLAARLSDILFQVLLEPKVSVARIELRRYHGSPEGLEAAMQQLFRQMSLVCFPLCIGAAAVVPLLFHAWLDPRWFGAIPIAQMLMLMGIPCVTLYCTSALLLALNLQKWEALISTVQTLASVLAVVCFARFGIVAVAAALALRPMLLLPLPVLLLKRTCRLPLRLIIRTQIPALVAAATMGCAVYFAGLAVESLIGSVADLLIMTALGAVGYVALIALTMPGYSRPLLKRVLRQCQGLSRSPNPG